MKTGYAYHEAFLEHRPATAHPENPNRLLAIAEALRDSGLGERMTPVPFHAADPSVAALIHDPAYVGLVNVACRRGMSFIGSEETYLCRRTYEVALLAIGAVVAACDEVMAGRIRNAFCAVRPPGHHAGRDYATGFCIFNNVAIAAEYLVRTHRLERVAIVDVDVHHGNGSQQLFEDRADVLYISVHGHPTTLFPGTGFDSETGCQCGAGYTLNIPMYPGSDDADYRKAFDTQVIPRLDEYRPQFILMSTGFDAARDDHMSEIDLEPESYGWMTKALVAAADKHCAGRLVSVLEGGYEAEILRRGVIAHVRALLNGNAQDPHP